ncbi:Flp pilus assembly protein CpaB [Candidatus Chloroploca asiatica]|uniref:Flp pilus assembly protein CpaB n=1 Tax=Candidatus Chloroploca asiatica TaxID=1506545 RepID=A0A2H3KFE6_9CHLR|nr:Flp pilus assembly protein CpaB [Candidatus Chloroploca asiatica]PDV96415.1 Flp pilus assembly protein CpaB [Candidatus Chloroploca asiatica]
MKRGGVLILLIGLILIVGGAAAFFFLQPGGSSLIGGGPELPTIIAEPTAIPEVDVVRARVDIPANTVINDLAALEVIAIPQTEFVERQDISTPGEVIGQLTMRAFRAGERIPRSALTEPGLSQQIPTAEPDRPADKAYPFLVNNLSGVADQIKPGDFVDVVATFTINRREREPVLLPPSEPGGPPQLVFQDNQQQLPSTKTIIQRAQVLRIVRPAPPPADGTPAPEGEAGQEIVAVEDINNPVVPPDSAAAGTITPGFWTLVLALNNQEAELMELAISTEARLVLVLRGAGDDAVEQTIGATLDLLTAEFGVPLPESLPPRIYSQEELETPDPTRTPAPVRAP